MKDATFFRATADIGAAMNLGRDTEVAFLAHSPTPKANRETLGADGEEDAQVSALQIQSSIYEVARVRMAPEAWVTLLMQVLMQAIENKQTTLAEFTRNLESVTSANLTAEGLVQR